MPKTLTLISSLESACLTDVLVYEVSKTLKSQNFQWLYPKVACDFTLSGSTAQGEAKEQVRERIGDLPIDIVIQKSENRRKKLFLADMDSTIIGQECIDELAAEIGIKEEVAAITEAAMNGEIDFQNALKDRVALLAGLDESVIDKVMAEKITINKGAKEALMVMHANGTYTTLVSGGFTIFASQIASQLGFNEFYANSLLTENGKFIGKVAEPVLGQQAKLDQLRRLRNEKDIQSMDTIAIGDGANDLPMLMNAGTGIAYYAKPTVAAKADITINHADLSAILFIQAYTKSDIDAVLG